MEITSLIEDGEALSSMCGVLVRKKSDFRVELNLELIMQSVAVEVGLDEVELLRK